VYSVLGDQHDIDRAKHHGVDAMSSDDLKKLNKSTPPITQPPTLPPIAANSSDHRQEADQEAGA